MTSRGQRQQTAYLLSPLTGSKLREPELPLSALREDLYRDLRRHQQVVVDSIPMVSSKIISSLVRDAKAAISSARSWLLRPVASERWWRRRDHRSLRRRGSPWATRRACRPKHE